MANFRNVLMLVSSKLVLDITLNTNSNVSYSSNICKCQHITPSQLRYRICILCVIRAS